MDVTGDLLTRIRNANARLRDRLDLPLSSLRVEIVKILKEEGFIANYKTMVGNNKKPTLRIFLKYSPTKERVIRGIRRVSRPGLRIYRSYKNIPTARGASYPVTILSTSKGLLTHKQAKEKKVGGEAPQGTQESASARAGVKTP